MKERIILKDICKSNALEDLLVYHASSSENEIWFYLNDKEYVVGRDNNNGTFSIKFEEIQEEIQEEKHENKSTLNLTKQFIKEKGFLKFFLVSIIISALVFILTVVPIITTIVSKNNIFISLLLINLINFFLELIFTLFFRYRPKSESLKSKHSAEHMMVNFLNKNKRLPKNEKELKETSRFSIDCGSKKDMKLLVKWFNMDIFMAIEIYILCIIEYSYLKLGVKNCEEVLLLEVIILAIYLAIFYGAKVLNQKYNNKLKFIIKPIENMLTYIIQCANTTKKVKDKDLILAYYVAKSWLQIAYLQFYIEDNNIFNESKES